MILRTLTLSVSALALLAVSMPAAPARANGFSPVPDGICSGYGGQGWDGAGGRFFEFNNHININKSFDFSNNINVFKNFEFNNHININKSFDFSKNINVFKNFEFNKHIDLSRNINIEKNIDLSKHIEINKNFDFSKKTIIITNDGGEQSQSQQQSQEQSQSVNLTVNNGDGHGGNIINVFGGGGSYTTIVNRGGGHTGFGVAIEQEVVECVEQWATVVKSIHAECVDSRGGRHPAVRMRPETWIDTKLSEEIFRCLPGAYLHVVIGDVVDSDQGIAAVYEGGTPLICRAGQALRHYQDGMVRCAVAAPLEDCVERTNMRRYGVGDVFFSFQAKVCARVAGARYANSSRREQVRGISERRIELQLNGMTLNGGVGW